jgi:hypothetical protein
VQAVQPSGAPAAADRLVRQPEFQELSACHDAVLSGRERSDFVVCGAYGSHIDP